MKLSEFRQAVIDEFGEAYGAIVTADLVIGELGDRTADQALADGASAREVWLALCRALDVPRSHWYGAGRADPRTA